MNDEDQAGYSTKYARAVVTRKENDRLISALREVAIAGNSIQWAARHSDGSKPGNLKLSFWCEIKLGKKTSNTLTQAIDALSLAFVGALNSNSEKDDWVQGIIDELEKDTRAAVEAAIGEINWLKEKFDA